MDAASADGDGGAAADAAAGGVWEQLSDVEGGAIQEIAVAELDGRIYLVGGFDGELAILDQVRIYDVATQTWTQGAPLPRPVHHANVAAVDGKLYVLGALTGLSFDQIGDVWEYDPIGNAWTTRTPMAPEVARGSAAVGVIDGKIYLAGGFRNGAAVALVSVYDPVMDTWDDSLEPLPEARDHLVGAAVGGIFYVISGRDGNISAITSRVDAYDPGTNAWTARTSLPTGRGGMAAGVVNDRIIVVGGEGDASSPLGVFSQTESYDPATDRWTSLAPMRTPRHGMGAAGYDGKLYVPGGATRQGFGAVATFESFSPR